MDEDKTFHLYASYNEYKDSSLLRDNESILGSDNDYLLNNKLDESKEILCTGDDCNDAKHPILDKIQIVLNFIEFIRKHIVTYSLSNSILFVKLS